MPRDRVDALLMRALHGAARLALSLQSPLHARRTVNRLGAGLRPFVGIDEARRAARILAGRGSCLSRSLALSARLPGSEVAIAVDARGSAHLAAHAWVELRGEKIDDSPPSYADETIARF